jgi:hypothetical protein
MLFVFQAFLTEKSSEKFKSFLPLLSFLLKQYPNLKINTLMVAHKF